MVACSRVLAMSVWLLFPKVNPAPDGAGGSGRAPPPHTCCTGGAVAAVLVVASLIMPLPISGDSAGRQNEAAGCVGDCNVDARVTVAELIRGVNIALGNDPVESCPALDLNGDGRAAIAELIAAVNNALVGCPPPSLPTPTSTPSGNSTPTAAGQS